MNSILTLFSSTLPGRMRLPEGAAFPLQHDLSLWEAG